MNCYFKISGGGGIFIIKVKYKFLIKCYLVERYEGGVTKKWRTGESIIGVIKVGRKSKSVIRGKEIK